MHTGMLIVFREMLNNIKLNKYFSSLRSRWHSKVPQFSWISSFSARENWINNRSQLNILSIETKQYPYTWFTLLYKQYKEPVLRYGSYTSTCILLSFMFLITYLLTYLLTELQPFLRSCQLCSHWGTSQHFKEPEDSSPCSQEPSTDPYPEPDRSSPTIPSYLSKIYFNIFHPPTSFTFILTY
jgi:hypothetical protein